MKYLLEENIRYKYEDPDEMQKLINAYNTKSPSDARSHAGHGSFIKSLGNLWGDDGLLEYMMHKDFMAYVNEYMLSEDLLYIDRSSTGVEHVHMILPDDNFVLDGKTILGMHSLHKKWVSSLRKGNLLAAVASPQEPMPGRLSLLSPAIALASVMFTG